jgi:hypothetical protein
MDELDDEINDHDHEDQDQAFRDEMELQDLIYQLPFDDLMDVNEFLHIDDCLKSNELTDNEIISMVKSNNNEQEIDLNEEPLEIISTREALGHLDNLVVFFEYSSNVSINPNELNVLQKLRHQILKSHIINSKQITLDTFVQIL